MHDRITNAMSRTGGNSVDKRPVEENQASPREHDWLPAATIAKLRGIIAGYIDGRREVDAAVEQLAAAFATAAHDAQYSPERMLIGVRALWREFTLTQHDRLQVATLYDRLVRRTIDKYYED